MDTKRIRRVMVLCMLLLAVVMILAATAVARPFDFAVGSGVNSAGEKFSFSAHEGPNGPSGYAKIEFPPSRNYPLGFRVQGHVTCFRVVTPNIVTFSFLIEKGSGSIPPGSRGFHFSVTDNGKHGDPSPDIMGTGFRTTDLNGCPQPGGITPVVKGDIKIRTAK